MISKHVKVYERKEFRRDKLKPCGVMSTLNWEALWLDQFTFHQMTPKV